MDFVKILSYKFEVCGYLGLDETFTLHDLDQMSLFPILSVIYNVVLEVFSAYYDHVLPVKKCKPILSWWLSLTNPFFVT